MLKPILLATFILIYNTVLSQEVIPLWEEQVPNTQPSTEQEIVNKGDIIWIEKVQTPSLEVYLPAKASATGWAVVICPGGGYMGLAYDWEGTDIARWLNSKGIAGIVLKYRMPQAQSVVTSHNAPLQDAQRAIRLVRSGAEQWNIEADQVGVMGFSAGGHLASTLGTHYDMPVYEGQDEVDAQSAKPDFMILMYPVITMELDFTHEGSRNALLGNSPTDELVNEFSNQLQITEETPPTILIHSADDDAVPVENSLQFYQELKNKGVYSEMHLYPTGGHGYSLAIGKGHLASWPDRVHDWLLSLD